MRVHFFCEDCKQWDIEGAKHSARCEPVGIAKHGESLCERCYESYPEGMLDMGFCPTCSNIINRVMSGDYSMHGL